MCNFNIDKWSKNAKDIGIQGILEKFRGNENIHKVLSSLANDVKIVEVSSYPMWGTGVPLSNDHPLFEQNWNSDGYICDIYSDIYVVILTVRITLMSYT